MNQKHKWILQELQTLQAQGKISKPRIRSSKGYSRFPIRWSIEGNFQEWGIKENFGKEFKAFIGYKGETGAGIIFIEQEKRAKLRKKLLYQLVKNPIFLKDREKKIAKYAKKLKQLTKGFTSKRVAHMSKEELMNNYNTFREIYTRYDFYNSLWFLVGDEFAAYLGEELHKFDCSVEEIQTLLTPDFVSFSHEERRAVLELAKKLQKSSFIQAKHYEEIEHTVYDKQLSALTKKFHWIPFLHTGPELYNNKHYFKQVQEALEKNIDEEIKKNKKYHKNLRKEKKKIIRKKNIPQQLQKLLQNQSRLAQMQDDRKEFIAKTHIPWTNILMRKIGAFFGLTGREAADLLPKTVEDFLLRDKKDLTEYRNYKNQQRYFYITEKDAYTTYYGDDAKPFLEIITKPSEDELQGQCACPGIVTGTVRILHSSDEIAKVNEGDILVTNMTTPDFVPAMHRAGGIITNEGGVTCHAAIVSREMNIPCIINTKEATIKLRDGETITMNANTGQIFQEKENKNNIVSINEGSGNESAGGKGRNLIELAKEFPVVKGFCLTTKLFKEIVDTESIAKEIQKVDFDDFSQVQKLAKEIREKIKKKKFSSKYEKDIVALKKELQFPVAVRSSGSAEDLQEASFAGQHDTYLNVTRKELERKILDCYASLYSDRAIYYRQMKGITQKVEMAVVVQEMLQSDVSGILYTKNPSTGNDEIIIEASHGLGELVVSGEVEPDKISIIANNISYQKGTKKLKLTQEGRKNNTDANKKCLTTKQVQELEQVAKNIEKFFGKPQDVEFAYKDKKLFILQSRSLTTIQKK